MLQKVRSPVFLTTYAASSVMSYRSAPHYIGACAIIFRIPLDAISFFNDSRQRTLTKTIAYFHILRISEITLHDMHHHIGDTASRLKRRQCISQFGIHNGKNRAQQFRHTQAQFLQGIHFRDNRVARTLATRSGNRQNNGNFQRFHHFRLTYKEIPKITFIRHTGSNSLCCVNHRAASYGEQ